MVIFAPPKNILPIVVKKNGCWGEKEWFANHWLNILPLVVYIYIYMYILHLSISYQQTIHARSSPVECVCMLLFNLQILIQYINIYIPICT